MENLKRKTSIHSYKSAICLRSNMCASGLMNQ